MWQNVTAMRLTSQIISNAPVSVRALSVAIGFDNVKVDIESVVLRPLSTSLEEHLSWLDNIDMLKQGLRELCWLWINERNYGLVNEDLRKGLMELVKLHFPALSKKGTLHSAGETWIDKS